MKPLTFKQHERLAEALAWIEGPLCFERGAEYAIEQLIHSFHGTRRQQGRSHTLHCAGVEARCSTSDCEGLLAAWVKLARQRLDSSAVSALRCHYPWAGGDLLLRQNLTLEIRRCGEI